MQNAKTLITQNFIDDLNAQIQGEIILPGDPAYNEARMVWNGMIDRYPAIIVRCTKVADVIAAVRAARAEDMLVSVRGGGHNVAGHATNDGGMVIDLSPMKNVSVDPERRAVKAQGGATWADVDRETQKFGLATPGGEVSETGIAGLTLGGGMGYLRRKYGLSCDNLISVDIVTAEGDLLHADQSENADLFWAVRGGGGNFGIVTTFEYRLYPVGPQVMTMFVMYPVDKAGEVMRTWRDFTATAPDEISSACDFFVVPPLPDLPEEIHNIPVVILEGMYAGPVDEAEKAFQPLREITTPIADLSGVSSYVEAQSGFDELVPPRVQRYYWKSLNLTELTDEFIETLIATAIDRPSPKSLIVLRHLGGAMGRVDAEATAFGDRSAQFNLSLDSIWVDPADDEINVNWTRAQWDAFQRFSNGGVYLNFPGLQEEGERLIRAQFGKNYERLEAIKRRYDPTNFFRLNQNITLR